VKSSNRGTVTLSEMNSSIKTLQRKAEG